MRDIGARSADSWAVFGGVRRPLCPVCGWCGHHAFCVGFGLLFGFCGRALSECIVFCCCCLLGSEIGRKERGASFLLILELSRA